MKATAILAGLTIILVAVLLGATLISMGGLVVFILIAVAAVGGTVILFFVGRRQMRDGKP